MKVATHLSLVQLQDNGIPHGSPLSGTLFMVAIEKVLIAINYPVKAILFAHDF